MLPSPKPEMSADDTNMAGAENQQKEGGAEAALLAARHSTGMTLSPS
jgi:hypothetical protein